MIEELQGKRILTEKLKEKIVEIDENIQEREEEINQVRDRNHDIIREYYLKLNLQKFIIDHFIPMQELEKIEEGAVWSDEIDDWVIPNLHLAGVHSKEEEENQEPAAAFSSN